MFSCEICEIFNNTFLAEQLRVTASVDGNLEKQNTIWLSKFTEAKKLSQIDSPTDIFSWLFPECFIPVKTYVESWKHLWWIIDITLGSKYASTIVF